jgi:hypothetical protein
MKKLLVFFLLLAGTLGACVSSPKISVPEEVYRDSMVAIYISSSEIVVQNVGSQPLYYLLFRAEELPYIEWAPCFDPGTCPDLALAPGDEEVTQLKGFVDRETEEITVYYWYLVENLENEGYLMQDLSEQFIKMP